MRLWLALLIWLLPVPLMAQDLAALVADSVEVDPAGRLTARGNVEVFYQGSRLQARSVTYVRDSDTLLIEGPITVTEPGGSVLSAESATLDRDLRNGILRSARLVLDRQLQLAASEIARVGDRYTRLDTVVASSCRVCANDPTPLWEIRARRVVHDEQEQQLYFENAQVRVAGVPVFYLPRLRLPDPTLRRATGLLIPQLRTTNQLGTGVKLPFFIALGDHADATVTPYISNKTRTMELRYRHLFRNAEISAIGAATSDDLEGDRGYLFANARYRLPRGFLAEAQVEFVSDPGYLFVYDYADRDRLTNEVRISRVREKDLFRASLTEFRTLREEEIPIRDFLPDRYAEIHYRREIAPLAFGGRTVATVEAAALNRPASDDILGRDVSRLGAALDWRRDAVIGPGLVLATELGIRADAYNIGQDSTFETNLTRVVPRAAAELRWPHARRTADGGREIIEPILRIDVAETGTDPVPLEDSRVVEFGEANLFSFSRYPGRDGVEDGTRIAAGVFWHRQDPDGWEADLAIGRVVNLDGDLGFADGSGLGGDRSEWLLAAHFSLSERLSVTSRSLLSESLDPTLSETRIDWEEDRFGLSSSYIYGEPEPAEGRDVSLSEWSFEGRLDLTRRWTGQADWRYDFNAGRAARAGVGLGYQNECIDLSLSVSRRYATSTSVDPTTDFGFRVALLGVGGRQAGEDARRACRG